MMPIGSLFLMILNFTIPINSENYIEGMKWSCRNGKIEYIYKLNKLGADLTANNNICLKLASAEGYLNIIRYVHLKGGNIRVDEDTPLVFAIYNEHIDVIDFLLSRGADPHSQFDFPIRLGINNPHIMNLFEIYGLKNRTNYYNPKPM
jgi:ankyrin repeat protein